MHALINLVKKQWKIIRPENELLKFTESEKLECEISKMSVNVELKTSCALTPYYSLELNLLSSTSHLLTPRTGFPAKFPARGWFRIPGTSIFCYVRNFIMNEFFLKKFTLIQILSSRCFDCLASVGSSRFACAH